MSSIHRDGRLIAFDEGGSGSPIVLGHGLLMNRTMWEPVRDGLGSGYRIVTIDAPGHGESDPAPPGFTVEDLASDMLAVCDSLGIGRAVFGGQSMGGFASQRIAASTPERVRALLLMDTNSGPESPEARPQYEAFLSVALADGVSKELAEVLLTILTSPTFAATPEADEWRQTWTDGDPRRFESVCRMVFERPDWTANLPKITAPAIVVHGEDDIAIGMDQAEALATALGAELVRVPLGGHASPLEQPAAVVPALQKFLESLPE